MDFAEMAVIDPLDPALLPPLCLAYRPEGAESSGVTPSGLREHFAADGAGVRAAMDELAGLAREAADGLRSGDPDALGPRMDGSFDVRARLLELDPAHVRMIDLARAHGASANYAGSGGAIIGTRPTGNAWPRLRTALEADGRAVIEPTLLPSSSVA